MSHTVVFLITSLKSRHVRIFDCTYFVISLIFWSINILTMITTGNDEHYSCYSVDFVNVTGFTTKTTVTHLTEVFPTTILRIVIYWRILLLNKDFLLLYNLPYSLIDSYLSWPRNYHSPLTPTPFWIVYLFHYYGWNAVLPTLGHFQSNKP